MTDRGERPRFIILLIAALVIVVLAAIFAVQNAQTIAVTFLFWQFDGSLALILVVTFIMGAIVALLASLPGLIRRQRTISGQRKTIKRVEKLIGKDEEPPTA